MRQEKVSNEQLPEKLPMSKKERIAAVIVCLILAAALTVGIWFLLNYLRDPNRSRETYSSPTAAAQAWFDAYQSNDYKAELNCYPKEVREYLITSAGDEETYANTFALMAQYAYSDTEVTLGEVKDADDTVRKAVEYYESTAGISLKIDEIKLVYFTFTSDTITVSEQDEAADDSTYVTTVKIGGNWYVMAS